MKVFFIPTIFFLSYFSLFSSNTNDLNNTADTIKRVTTNPIVVTGSREPELYSNISRIITIIPASEIKQSSATSLEDVLQMFSSVDVRRRGGPSAQADFSIRGGTSDQTLIMLDGIPMSSSQTGHHNCDLPISLSNIDHIEILEGSGAKSLGNNAFSGGINIITDNLKAKRNLNLSAQVGQFNEYEYNISSNFNLTENISNYYSFYREKNDGYIENTDTDVLNFFGSNKLKTSIGSFNIIYGYNKRKFGANSFYTADFPNQYEETEALLGAIKHNYTYKNISIDSRFNYNIHYDKFELFRNGYNAPSWYTNPNFHKTTQYEFETKSTLNLDKFSSVIGININHDKILSNVLGLPLTEPIQVANEIEQYYTKSDERNNFSLFTEHTLIEHSFTANIGAFANYNSKYAWNIYGGVDLSYKFNESSNIFLSINQSGRLPNYTDLYYEGPTNKGNPNLTPEKSLSLELGYKYFNEYCNSSISIFRNYGTNLIDWIKKPDSLLWETQNLTELITNGFEISFKVIPKNYLSSLRFINLIYISYTFITSEKNSNDMLSLYALDYLQHKLNIATNLQILTNLYLGINYVYQKRNGNYFSYATKNEEPFEGYSLVSAKLNYTFERLNVFVSGDNFFNKTYQDIPNVQEPGRWLYLGINYKIEM